MYEHKHGGLACEGSGQENKTCNAWLDTKNDLLICEAVSKKKSVESAVEIAALQQTLQKREEKIIVLEVLMLRLIILFNPEYNNTVQNLQNACNLQQECGQKIEQGNANDFNYEVFPRESLKCFNGRRYLKHNTIDHFV